MSATRSEGAYLGQSQRRHVSQMICWERGCRLCTVTSAFPPKMGAYGFVVLCLTSFEVYRPSPLPGISTQNPILRDITVLGTGVRHCASADKPPFLFLS